MTRITGCVRDRITEHGIPELRVEAWLRGLAGPLAAQITDATGGFELVFDEARLRSLRRKVVNVHFKVFRDQTLLRDTHGEITWFPKAGAELVLIPIEQAANRPLPAAEAFAVRGRVTHPTGKPFLGVTVRAYDKDIRNEELLGETVSGRGGHFEVRYSRSQFARAEKGAADLVVRGFDREGIKIAESGILFNADPDVVVNLTAKPQPDRKLSEFERLVARLTPSLDNVSLSALTETDIEFLNGHTGEPKQRIEFLRSSARLSVQTGLPTEVVYGWAREGHLPQLEDLLSVPLEELRQALERAIGANIIPGRFHASVDTAMGAVSRLKQKQEAQTRVPHTVEGQLLDAEASAPLPGLSIHALDLDATTEPRDLGNTVSGRDGIFAITYFTPPGDDRARADGGELSVSMCSA
jgi:hypothetical protein